ncbi:uncharacterized GPI-anchored protein At4g28100-like [Cicer arietinum]|uniref:Uncharacterized GPI-anchored protein At4g28100-like n=1 Tax=Cicer arietinum TaxID=3827 RepID=A0A1S2Z091_CICAR|nr:uncharacterized GPI-anchored protein At4g28100-like [Cicer arietinum]
MSLSITLFLYILFFPSFMSCQHDPNKTSTLKPILPTQSSHPTTLTIPSFQDQSFVKGCPLSLSNDLFDGIKSACSSTKDEFHRRHCCPVLAAWLYSSYSSIALGELGHSLSWSSSSDLPLVPDDSETCVNGLEKALKLRGIEMIKPNESCDLVYCYCGIRLHPFSCSDAFSVTKSGELVGDESVRMLEKNCLISSKTFKGFSGLEGCSKCLNNLYLLNKKTSNSSKIEDRTTKIHNKDCELMGLTWLLSKNRTAYIHTVSDVLRALLWSTNGSKPKSCTLNSDGMPLAVDSSEIYYHSSSLNLQPTMSLSLLLLICLVLCMHVIVLIS